MNPFRYSLDNKRYHTLYYHNKVTFGEKLYKAVIDAGFTCPNKDGTKGVGGCIFCGGGSGYFTADPAFSVREQLDREICRIHAKAPESRVTAYFQANTNTYAPVERLREVFEEALSVPYVAGLSIGTRADCLPDDVLRLLCELSEKTFLTVELGMQTVHEKTLSLINRGYTHSEFLKGYKALKERGIRVCVHVIDGLPFESLDDMLETARQLGELSPDAVKIQLLHVIRGTRLEGLYNDGVFSAMTREEYIGTVTRQLELLPPETVIERITGDGDRKTLIAPKWSMDKIAVLGGIDKRQRELDTWQGKFYEKNRKSLDKVSYI